MSAPRTLCNIRADADPADRMTEALTPTQVANPYLHASQPKTLEDLRAACGKQGPAAVEVTKWDCVSGWCMKQQKVPDGWLNAVFHTRNDAMAKFTGKLSTMTDMPIPIRLNICRKSIDALRAWEAAGCPNLLRNIRTMHEWVFNLERIAAETKEHEITAMPEAEA